MDGRGRAFQVQELREGREQRHRGRQRRGNDRSKLTVLEGAEVGDREARGGQIPGCPGHQPGKDRTMNL